MGHSSIIPKQSTNFKVPYSSIKWKLPPFGKSSFLVIDHKEQPINVETFVNMLGMTNVPKSSFAKQT